MHKAEQETTMAASKEEMLSSPTAQPQPPHAPRVVCTGAAATHTDLSLSFQS